MAHPEPPASEQPAPPAAPGGARRRMLKRVPLVPIAAFMGFIGFIVWVATLCGCDFRSAATRIEASRLQGMKADLRNLVTAEESYFADQVTYTTSLERLRFRPSDSVTVTIGSATGTGWSAIARHKATTKTCGIYVGTATAPISGQNEGAPKCQE